jgi:hypothetical protein
MQDRMSFALYWCFAFYTIRLSLSSFWYYNIFQDHFIEIHSNIIKFLCVKNVFLAIILLKLETRQITNTNIENECYELIDLAEEQGIVHRTKRNFANMKTLCFVSLQLDVVSSECL